MVLESIIVVLNNAALKCLIDNVTFSGSPRPKSSLATPTLNWGRGKTATVAALLQDSLH